MLVPSNGSSAGSNPANAAAGLAMSSTSTTTTSNVNGVSNNDSTAEIRRLQDEVNQLTKRNGGTAILRNP